MAACTALLPDASLSLYKVEADPDFLAFFATAHRLPDPGGTCSMWQQPPTFTADTV